MNCPMIINPIRGLLLSITVGVLFGTSCGDDFHPDHLVNGYDNSPWVLETKVTRLAEGFEGGTEDFDFISLKMSGINHIDQLICLHTKRVNDNDYAAYTSGTVYETLCKKHGDLEKPPVSWVMARHVPCVIPFFSIIDFASLEVTSSEAFDKNHPANSSLLDLLHFATTTPYRVLQNNYRLYFNDNVLYLDDGAQLFNTFKKGSEVMAEDMTILKFIYLSFDKLLDPVEPKHIRVRLTADDGKVYDFETLLTFQEIN